jgi:EmrB/QacA subfamily drug resistance transporter
MGIGGALIMPSTLSILTNVFRDPTERGRAIAIWAGFSGLAVAIGPMTGGFLLEHFSWSSVFWINVPIAAIAFVLGMFIIPKSRDPRQSKLDPLGAVLSIVGLASLLYGIIEGPNKGWSSDHVVVAFAIAAVTLASFVVWERRTSSPMLDMSLFKNPRFTAASSTITLVFFALFGSMFLITQYWQLVHGYSALETGVRLLPHAATMMIVAPLSARIVERVGTKKVVLTGLTLIMVGLVLLSTLEPLSPYPRVITYFCIMAAGMGMTMAPATESVMGSLPREKAGVGSAVNDTTRQVGGALGVAIIGSAVTSVYASRIGSLSASYGLDQSNTDAAESSLGAAQHIAGQLGERGASFLADANQIFVDSMAIGLRVAVGVIAIAALMAWRFLPARATTPAASPDEVASGNDSQDADVTAAPPAAVPFVVRDGETARHA